MELTKFEIARRQLVTAIRLLFADEDTVSIYTLAHASAEILDALCRHQRKVRFRGEMAKANQRSVDDIKKIVEFGKNFLKHADRDPEDILTGLTDDINDHLILSATFDFGEISQTKPLEIQVFQLWYFAVYPDKSPFTFGSETTNSITQLFGPIDQCDRAKQKKAALSVLKQAIVHPALLSDPSTDTTRLGAL